LLLLFVIAFGYTSKIWPVNCSPVDDAGVQLVATPTPNIYGAHLIQMHTLRSRENVFRCDAVGRVC